MRKLYFLLLRIGRRDLRLLWYAIRHPQRPVWLIPALILLTVYAVSPLSYAIPILGLVDDLVVVPLALHFLISRLPPQLRTEGERL